MEYWTISHGQSIRTWSCRECRQPIYKDEPMVVRDGRKIRLFYHVVSLNSNYRNAFLALLIPGLNPTHPFMMPVSPTASMIRLQPSKAMASGQYKTMDIIPLLHQSSTLAWPSPLHGDSQGVKRRM